VARQLLEAARETVAAIIGTKQHETSFQASSQHVAAISLDGFLTHSSHPILVSRIERDSVLRSVSRTGPSVTQFGVDSLGVVDLDALEITLDRVTNTAGSGAILALQAANGEIGTRQPLVDVAQLCGRTGSALVVDATDALGLVPIDSGWDVLHAQASGWAGPRGLSVMAIRDSSAAKLGLQWRDPDTYRSRPLDTDDVASAVAAAAALDAVYRDRAEVARLAELVDLIRDQLPRLIPDIDLLGDPINRLPHIVTFSCLYADGERLAAELDRLGFGVGSGSACAARSGLPSHVLEAIGSLTHGNIRLSLPFGCTQETVEGFLAVLPGVVAQVRADAGAPQ